MGYIAYAEDFLVVGENGDGITETKGLLLKELGIAHKFLGIEINYGNDGSIEFIKMSISNNSSNATVWWIANP